MNHSVPLRFLPRAVLLALSALCASAALADVYVCTDAQGRRLSADRPIAACSDRPQRVLSAQGLLLRIVPPAASPLQHAQEQERKIQDDAQSGQLQAHQRAQRLLFMRYPTRASHEGARTEARANAQRTMASVQERIAALREQGAALQQEMAAYRQNPAQAPATLRSRIQINQNSIAQLQALQQQQKQDLERIDQRFDAEAASLASYWQRAQEAAMR